MKVLKGIFYTLAVLIIAACAFILICAVNPKMTQALSEAVSGVGALKGFAGFLDKIGGSDEDGISGDASVAVIDGNDIIVPGDVSGLTGYIPISSDEETITDKAAEEIKKSLSTGETGDGLSFDSLFYPYYAMLSSDEQAVYRQIYANAKAINSAFAPVKAITSDQLAKIFEAVVNDHPELFYLRTSYTVKYTKSGSVVEIQLSYYTIANALDSATENFESAAAPIIAGAASLESDYDKEKYVHNYLLSHVTYDKNATNEQSAYSALVGGRSVCAGYARANQYVMQKLGIPCYYCVGYAGEDHAWNIVKLSDGYYNEDITWDDTDPTTYDYFNKTDSDYAPTHRRTSLSVYLPPCEGQLYRNLEKGSAQEVEGGDPSSITSDEEFSPLRYDDLYPAGNSGSSGGNSGSNSGTSSGENADSEQSSLVAALLNLGYKETDADWTLEDYYADCKTKLIAAGSGDRHFICIVPAALFSKIEKEYGNGGYKKGYVEESLKSLGMNHFSIQIQAERMGGGFYRLYHNVVSWKDDFYTAENTDSTDNTNNNSNSNTNSNTNNNTNNNSSNNSSTNTNTNTNNNSNSGNSDSSLPLEEQKKNALAKAKAYLESGIYSSDALKKVLTETDGYTNSVAEYAITNCGADWTAQALKKAKDYIANGVYSAQALINALADKDLFTTKQAEDAVGSSGIDFNEQAVKRAKQYLADSKNAYSAAGMKKLLTDTDKFTAEQAAYAIENCGADWKAQAVKKAKEYATESESLTHEELVAKLKEDGFTAEEAEYGANQNGR